MENIICTQCKVEQPLSEFSKAPTAKGYKTKCKTCTRSYNQKYMLDYYKNNTSQYEKHKKYVAKNDSEYKKAAHRLHGLTSEEFNMMMNKHDQKCWICRDRYAFAIDHDHSCCAGSFSCGDCVRGVLCAQCNTSLGQLKESVSTLENMIEYIKSPPYRK